MGTKEQLGTCDVLGLICYPIDTPFLPIPSAQRRGLNAQTAESICCMNALLNICLFLHEPSFSRSQRLAALNYVSVHE